MNKNTTGDICVGAFRLIFGAKRIDEYTSIPGWFLPGGGFVKEREAALEIARKLSRAMREE